MGKGLFGADGGGSADLGGNLLERQSGRKAATRRAATDRRPAAARSTRSAAISGETLGNLIQQGLSEQRPAPAPRRQSAAAGNPPPRPQARRPRPRETRPRKPQQDSQPMNDVLRQLFNR